MRPIFLLSILFSFSLICHASSLIIQSTTSTRDSGLYEYLLPYYPDFRWLLEIKNSPWYPTIKIYRQDEKKDWKKTFKEAVDDLGNFLN